jgi:tetratricopeptide (TPR) repeat protein
MILERQNMWFLIFVSVALAGAAVASARVGGSNGNASIEWAYLATYPEAESTKIHVYVRNSGSAPIFVEGIHFGERYVSFNAEAEDLIAQEQDRANLEDSLLGLRKEESYNYSYIGRRTDGTVQWCRALPNPIGPGAISDVTVSLWDTVKEMPIRIVLRGGQELVWNAQEQKRALRLSHIAFDPVNPNRVYIYVENLTGEDAEVTQVQANSATRNAFQSIPAGGKIKALGKTCLVADCGTQLQWGEYAAFGVLGRKGEKVFAVVRVSNLFPICSWPEDTRRELFFDDKDILKPLPLSGMSASSKTAPEVRLAANSGRADQAYYDGMDPTCLGKSYEDNARKIIRTMSSLWQRERGTPFFTHLCKPSLDGYAFYGELPDFAFVNPFTTMFRAPYRPEASSGFLKAARTWIDPRPAAAIPEAFTNSKRDLTPDEVCFSTWAEVAEGAKGVKYYVRSGGADGHGYTEMSGAEQTIGRTNLDLQLLKPFLRVGDTSPSVSSDHDTVTHKSILCADKGIVIILLNRNYSGGNKVAALWAPTENLPVHVDVPAGLHVKQVYEVDQGLRGVEFSEEGDRLDFSVPRLDVRRVFLLSFCEVSGTVAQAESKSSGSPGEEIARTVKSYLARLEKLGQPLLHTSTPIEAARAIEIGLSMGRLRTTMLEHLAHVEEQTRSMAADKKIPLALSLASAYLDVGAAQQLEAFCRSILGSTLKVDCARTCSALALRCLESGKYLLAVELYTRAFQDDPDVETRFKVAGQCVDLFENKLLDLTHAVQWAVVRANLEGEDPAMTARARIHAAELLLENSQAAEALTELEKVNADKAGSLPLHYLLAEAYMKTGKLDKAIEHFRATVERDPARAPKSQYMIGLLLLSQHEDNQALAELEKVSKQYPDSEYASMARKLAGRIQSRKQAEK